MEAAVRPERLLKDLRNLWVDLGKQEPSGVLRACAMTLIVVAEEERDVRRSGKPLLRSCTSIRAARLCCVFVWGTNVRCRRAFSRNAGCPSDEDSKSVANRSKSSAVSPASLM